MSLIFYNDLMNCFVLLNLVILVSSESLFLTSVLLLKCLLQLQDTLI